MKKKRGLLKLAAGVLLAGVTAAVFSGCSLSKDDIELLDEKGAKEYVSQYTDTWEYLGCDVADKYRKTYSFTDTEMGFDFTLISSVSGEGMDGTTFYYTCSNRCDWQQQYTEKVSDSCRAQIDSICGEKDADCEWGLMDTNAELILHMPDGIDLRTETEFYDSICDTVSAADPKGKFSQLTLYVYSKSGQSDTEGSYTKEGGYVTSDEALVDSMLEKAASQLDKNNSRLTVIKTEKITRDELDKMDIGQVTYYDPLFVGYGDEFTVMYFRCEQKTYKAINVEVDDRMYLTEVDE